MADTVTMKSWPLAGYAPGRYTCTCLECQEQFEGDKRAFNCLECAAALVNAQIAGMSEGARRTAPAEPATIKPLLFISEYSLDEMQRRDGWTTALIAPRASDLGHIDRITPLYAAPPASQFWEVTMTDTSKTTVAAVVEGLLKACNGHPHAKIAWPHRILHEAASLISALEAERDDARSRLKEESREAFVGRKIVGRQKSLMLEAAAAINETLTRLEAAEAQVAALQAKLEKAAEERDEWLRFIARWAWDKTGPADERLSVIQYFPPVKAARPEPLSTLRETTDDQT